MPIPTKPGSYCVAFNLQTSLQKTIGRIGEGRFLPGHYLYCGSAKGKSGLKNRVSRHLNNATVKFWHIDYLKEHLIPIRVWYIIGEEYSECDLVNALEGMREIQWSMRGFGASDCTHGCRSHLFFAAHEITLDSIYDTLFSRIPDVEQELLVRE